MKEYAISKVSSKGQIVIPKVLREEISAGDEYLILKEGNNLLLKPMKDLSKSLKEDLEFARRTEEAWQEIEKGNFISYDNEEEFLNELEKW